MVKRLNIRRYVEKAEYPPFISKKNNLLFHCGIKLITCFKYLFGGSLMKGWMSNVCEVLLMLKSINKLKTVP